MPADCVNLLAAKRGGGPDSEFCTRRVRLGVGLASKDGVPFNSTNA